MSKKHKKKFGNYFSQTTTAIPQEHAAEYEVIKWDLVRLVIFNAIVLVGVLALYYTNRESKYLEEWFSQFIKF
jgi:hypothetical protein